MDVQIDSQTAELITDVLGGVALAVGVPASVTVPAVAIGKLAARLSDAGVEIPDTKALTVLQERLRSQEELPG